MERLGDLFYESSLEEDFILVEMARVEKVSWVLIRRTRVKRKYGSLTSNFPYK